ncbi:uncharacterized protein [Penaeus vannamei]|uniref:uncharacterized protein n=1 Tax=Penaeus vannamei TaxID=6689 RepID=UPI00387F5E7B
MDSRAVLELNIAESFTRRDGTSELYVVRESAIPGMAAWPIPHDSPFKKNLDFCIRASLEAGLYEKWENDMLEMARRESRERQRRQQKEQPQDEEEADGSDGGIQALTLVHMQGPLMLLLLGLLLGALAFLLEMVTSSKGREKRNNADLLSLASPGFAEAMESVFHHKPEQLNKNMPNTTAGLKFNKECNKHM